MRKETKVIRFAEVVTCGIKIEFLSHKLGMRIPIGILYGKEINDFRTELIREVFTSLTKKDIIETIDGFKPSIIPIETNIYDIVVEDSKKAVLNATNDVTKFLLALKELEESKAINRWLWKKYKITI